MITIIINTTLLALFGLCAFFDIKYRALPWIIIAIGFVSGFVLQAIWGELKIYEILMGCLPGIAALVLARLTKESIGYGDCLMIAASGTFLGLAGNVFLIIISLVLAAVFSLGKIILKRARRKEAIPFMPFMLGGYIFMLAVF